MNSAINKQIRWGLTALTSSIPFLIVYLNSKLYYSSSVFRYSKWCFFGLPIAMIALVVPVMMSPIKDAKAKKLFSVIFVTTLILVLFLWNLECAILNGDSF